MNYIVKDLFDKVYVVEEVKTTVGHKNYLYEGKRYNRDYGDSELFEVLEDGKRGSSLGCIDTDNLLGVLDNLPYVTNADGSEDLAEDWYTFSKGTMKEEIYDWFYNEFGIGVEF